MLNTRMIKSFSFTFLHQIGYHILKIKLTFYDVIPRTDICINALNLRWYISFGGMHTPHPHSCKHDGKVVIAVVHHVLGFLHQTGLPTNLSCNLVKPYLILIELTWIIYPAFSLHNSQPHCVEGLRRRKWVFSGLWRCCSSHRWPIFPSGSSPLGRCDTEGWSADLPQENKLLEPQKRGVWSNVLPSRSILRVRLFW